MDFISFVQDCSADMHTSNPLPILLPSISASILFHLLEIIQILTLIFIHPSPLPLLPSSSYIHNCNNPSVSLHSTKTSDLSNLQQNFLPFSDSVVLHIERNCLTRCFCSCSFSISFSFRSPHVRSWVVSSTPYKRKR